MSRGEAGLSDLPEVGPFWEEIEDWDDVMPHRPTLSIPLSEWDVDDGFNTLWSHPGSRDATGEVEVKVDIWPRRVRCLCGHARTKHGTTELGPCKAHVTIIAPDGGFGSEPCACVEPEPATHTKETPWCP